MSEPSAGCFTDDRKQQFNARELAGSVHLNRQHFIFNTADGIQTLEVHFAAWIETANDRTSPKDLPPLDRDPNAPLERPITLTPPPS